jgi:dipeptidyl aminopeptidase/acylaminoacyl peptidase
MIPTCHPLRACRAAWLTAFLLLAGVAVRAAGPLPTEAFARLPQAEWMALSPNGQWFAAVMNRGGEALAVTHSVDGQEPIKALLKTDNREFRLSWVRWVSDSRLVIGVRFPEKRLNTETIETRLVAVDRDGGNLVTLVEPNAFSVAAQLQDQVVDWLPGDGHHILLQAPVDRRDISPAVWRVDVDTGQREVVQGRSFRVDRWITDATHRVRVGVRHAGTQVEVTLCDPDGEHWRTAWTYEVFGRDAITPLGFGDDPQVLYASADHDGRRAVYEVDLRDPALPRKLLLDAGDQDLQGGLIIDPASGQAIGVRSNRYGNAAASFWAPAGQALARAIDQALPDRFNRLLQFSADGSRYLLYSSGNGVPGRYLVGDRKAGQLSLLTAQYPQLPAQSAVRKQRFTVQARDGLSLPVFLTVPAGAEARNLPTVVLPHGGPISHDDLDFDPLSQFLADRGYAVMQVNFRGSGGQGHALMAAGLQRWGLEMQDDLEDALRWSIQRGTSDGGRTCIVGSSYGGYAALMGGAKTPGLYRCVASLAGISDLQAYALFRGQYVNGRELFERQVGSTWSDSDRLKATSPRLLAAKFQAPVLLVHGAQDRAVPFEQSELMAQALKSAGKPVRLLKLEDGDHTLSVAEHRLTFYRELEKFLDENLAVH